MLEPFVCSTMEIRQLKASDVESVIEVARLSWEWTYQSIYSHEFIESWIREKYAKHAISDQITRFASGQNGIFLGAFQNNKLIGFIHAVVNDSEAEIAIRNFSFKGTSDYHPVQCKVIFSPIFRRGLPASTVTSGTSTCMNSLRSGGTLISMPSHLTLRTQARTEPHVIRPSSILSAGEHCNISRKHRKGFTFIPPFRKGFPAQFR